MTTLRLALWGLLPLLVAPPSLRAEEAPAAQAAAVPTGQYACSFAQGGLRYRAFTCRITRGTDERLQLEKLNGSQRIRGAVEPKGEGFTFRGTYFCPVGSCDRAVTGEFQRQSAGVYVGRLDDPERTQVKLVWRRK